MIMDAISRGHDSRAMTPPTHGIAAKASIPVTVCIAHIIAMRSPVCFKKRFHVACVRAAPNTM